MGAIVSLFRTVVDFLMNFKALALAVYNLFKKFPQDPFGTIIGLLAILLGTILGLILFVIWLLNTLMGVGFILAFVYATLVPLLGGILYTVGMFVLVLLLALPYFGLWLMDLPTGGLVVRLMRCENLPSSWYEANRFDDDNGYLRFVPFVCLKPCSLGYVTNAVCFCAKLPSYMPDYCPQQQVYRVYRNIGSLSLSAQPFAVDKFTPPSGFKKLTKQKRRQMILDAFDAKMQWYQRCYATLTSFDYLNRHLCHNAGNLGLSPADTVKLCRACREVFCNSAPGNLKHGLKASMLGRKLEGNWQSFAPNNGRGDGNRASCDRLDNLIRNGGVEQAPDGPGYPKGPGVEMLKRALTVFVVAMCMLIALYSLAEATNSLVVA